MNIPKKQKNVHFEDESVPLEARTFEFRKLEFTPQKVNINTPIPIVPKTPEVVAQPEKQNNYSNLLRIIGACLFLGTGIFLGFLLFSQSKQSTTSFKPNSLAPTVQSSKTLVAPATNQPKYINYYDSVVFLNEVKGEKLVVSKGVDDYIKKEKLIVKVSGNYYNCFCKDLIAHYKVGEVIP